ncbi:enoyl-CoA hydratase/isomerase family protein [Candidatus Solirubrobacter pratensis]|uniref:enoyl-CoA hydratase/isomerase family protein n=1 Tax=Candidatus Solirubrobacter pratensis TaxID=1298857 RepID=UPI000407CE1B|nr:enoyl-CoA hydratase/isomerase family protein [Candidatus Solirubrobacter pratensis]
MTPVRTERAGGLAILTLDSPPLNLFDEALIEGLEAGVRELDGARALLIRAEGRAVSAGVDVHLFDGLSEHAAAALFHRLLELTRRVESLPFPVVFAAHGLCLTAAFEVALASDLILAAESARFGLVESVIAITPAMGGTQRLAERAGTGRARELVMTGDLYGAAELERWNVVNRVLPDEGFGAAALAFATRLADGPTRAHAVTKQIVRAFVASGVKGADSITAEAVGDLWGTQDTRGAIRSFLENGPGKASFSGR